MGGVSAGLGGQERLRRFEEFRASLSPEWVHRTVQEELVNRNDCRTGLHWCLLQLVEDFERTRDTLANLSCENKSGWHQEGHLLIYIGGHEYRADQVYLRSKWPAKCCPVIEHNPYNS